jgi:hypothetical protein
MALDVYVGSLTRYYTGDWENVVERAARERGVQYRAERQGHAADAESDPRQARALVSAWQRNLSTALGEKIAIPLAWSEAEDAPYFTERPGWDAFGSLVLWAAYAEQPGLRRPPELAEEWDDDPALVRSNAEGFTSRFSHLVRNVELWLPSPFEFVFEAEDVGGSKIVIGSVITLRRQLVELNQGTWQGSEDLVASWSKRVPGKGDNLEAGAQHAFGILFDLATMAADQRLPMKLDY